MIGQRLSGRRASVYLVVWLLGSSVAIGRQEQAFSQSQASGEAGQAPAASATGDQAPPTPYDIGTAKRLTGDWNGVRTQLEDAGVNFSIMLGTMTQFNFRGGLNTHNAHETGGKAFYNLELDFGEMGLIPGGTFFVRGVQTWNSGIQADVGSLTPPYWSAGSDGDQEILLDKYWYRQRLFDDRLEFRLGKLLNVVDLFDSNDTGGNYMSRFMNRALNHNLTIPTTKSLGAFARAWPTDWFYFQAAALDPDIGQSTHTRGTGGWDTAFHGEDRFRVFGEFGMLPDKLPEASWLPGHYRFGWWLDPKPKAVYFNDLGGLRAPQYRNTDMGFYCNFDQLLWKENDDPKDPQGLSMFARYGVAHRDVNQISHAWNIGGAYQGVIPERNADVLGFGVAQSILSSAYRSNVDSRADRETVYELFYTINLTPWCTITPDVQVITNPGGGKDARDALIGGIRVKIEI
ncbi:MAG: carbohydrate porin [Planctomycetes bacterium]|nr:carbohydrate porin [Planctomycetota bacterium]